MGGSGDEQGYGIAVDASGNAYVTGFTLSSNFPTTPGAFQPTYGGNVDAFVSKLNDAGSALVYSTYLGGSDQDEGHGIVVDASGNTYVAGCSFSSDFPTTSGAFQPTYGGNGDAFISKLNAAGSALLYSTYLGGSGDDFGGSLGVDASGNVYVTGSTGSSDFPATPGAFQITLGGSEDAFVAKISPADAPGLALGPGQLTFVEAVGTTSAPQTATLLDAGSQPLSITSIVASGDFAQTNDCGSSVPAGTSCTITVTFTPTATGILTGAITITDNAAGSPHQLPLTGTGGIPAVSLTPASLTFGPQAVGTTSPAQPATLKNTGSGPLSITSIAAVGDFAQTNNCGRTVQAGAACTFNVTFTPTATGTRFGSVIITDDAAGSPHQLFLTGTGGIPLVTLTPASMTFLVLRTVGTTSLPHTVKLTNTGSAALDITGITLTGPDPRDFAQSNNCPPTVALGASCLITITFTPTTQGVRTASVSITDSAPGSPQTVPLKGRGTFFEWSPRSVNLGDQKVGTSSPARTVTLSNAGTAPITLYSIEMAGVNPDNFSQTNNCGSSLKAGASCTMQVTFTPTAVGARLGHVAIRDSAFGGTHWVDLLGKGT